MSDTESKSIKIEGDEFGCGCIALAFICAIVIGFLFGAITISINL